MTVASLSVIEPMRPQVQWVSDRLYGLETGAVVAEGLPADVVRVPRVVASYLGDDAAAINRSGKVA